MGNSACLPSVQTVCEQRLFWRAAHGGRGRSEGVPGGIHLQSCSKGQTSADESLLTPRMWGADYELDSSWLVGVGAPPRLPTGPGDGVAALSAEALRGLSPVQRIFFSGCPHLAPPLGTSWEVFGQKEKSGVELGARQPRLPVLAPHRFRGDVSSPWNLGLSSWKCW